MKHTYRHGDLALIGVDSIPDGLRGTDSNVLLENGSGGHNHTFKGGNLYLTEKKDGELVVGYLEAIGTKLYHPEHGDKQVGDVKESKIEDGIYEVRIQVEHTHEGMKQVVD